MELQVSHRICAEISQEGILRRETARNRRNIADTVQLEKYPDHRSGSVSGSCAHAFGDTAKDIGSSFMGYLKGKSSLMIYEKFPELRYKYRNREFWCRGYYVDTAGKNAKRIEEYIRHQLDEDKAGEQLTMGNF